MKTTTILLLISTALLAGCADNGVGIRGCVGASVGTTTMTVTCKVKPATDTEPSTGQ